MSKFYTEQHRALQEKFDTRRTADMLENTVVHSEFVAHEAEFIQTRHMFFLSTVDAFRPADGVLQGRRARLRPCHQRLVAVVSQL